MQGNEQAPQSMIESLSIEHVPVRDRRGLLRDQAPFWFMGNCNFFTLAIGFVGPSLGLDLLWTSIASAIGILAGTLVMALHASQGPRLGLPQMVQSRAQFGYRGVIIPLLASLATFVGFNIIDTVLLADGLGSLYGFEKVLTSVILAVGAGALALLGYDWIHRAFKTLFWLNLPVFAILTLAILTGQVVATAPATNSFSWPGFAAQLAICASYNVTFAPYVSDYTRYLPERTPVGRLIASVFAGAASSAIWLIILGAWMATNLGAGDGLVALRGLADQLVGGGGNVIVALSVFSLIGVMSLNVYSGMLTAVTVVNSFTAIQLSKKLRVICIVSLMMVWLYFSSIVEINAVGLLFSGMTIMLYLLVPWSAINLADYFIHRRGIYSIDALFDAEGEYGRWSASGLIAYFAGLAASIPFASLPGMFVGAGAHFVGDIDIAWVVSLLVSGTTYLVLQRRIIPLDPVPESP